MANEQMTFSLGIKTTADMTGINQLKKSLRELSTYGTDTSFLVESGLSSSQISKSITSIQQLGRAMDAAFDTNLNGINFNTFQKNLKNSNTSLTEIGKNLSALGPEGTAAFAQATSQIFKMNSAVQYTNGAITKLFDTFKNTIVYTGFNAILNTVSKTVSNAFRYIEDLDKSLNNIRIVSGQSAENMAEFANQANKAAKELGATTTAYTDAALIYYQQGLRGEDVTERTDVTQKMANVTGETAEKVSQDLTAIWNNFYDGSKSLEYYADVLTALGASTASSTDEIAAGLEKFAAISSTVGLSYEYATSALATVVAETRQSADTVGTAFKTLFARIQGLKLGDTLEDGTDLNKYSQALMAVGINIKTSNGELKEMDVILDELGAKWQQLNKDEQVALAQTVAGTRQYSQLVALMDNWDVFQKNLGTTANATGELQKQQDIYMESTAAHMKQLKAASEDLYSSLFDSKSLNGWIDGFTNVIEQIDNLTEALGGLNNIAPMLLLSGLNAFSGKIATIASQSMTNASANQIAMDNEIAKQQYLKQNNLNTSLEGEAGLELEKQLNFYKEMLPYASQMTQYEQDQYNNLVEVGAELIKQRSLLDEESNIWKTVNRNIISINFNDITGSIEKLNKGTKEFRQFLRQIEVDFKETEGNANDLGVTSQKVFEAMITSLSEAGIKVSEIQKYFDNNISKLNEGVISEEEFRKGLEKLITPAEKVAESMEYIKNNADAAHGAMERTLNGQVSRANIQGFIQLASSIGQVAIGIQTIQNLGSIIKNDDLSTTQKFLQIIINTSMSLSMLLPLLKSIISLTKKETLQEIALNAVKIIRLKTENKLITKAGEEAIANKISVMSKGELIKANIGLLSTELALLGPLAAVAAAAAAAGLAIYGLIKWYNADADAAKRASENVKELNNIYKESSSSAEKLRTSLEQYQKGLDGLKNLTKGTQEFQNALEESNKKARELIETYKLWNDYVVNSQGLIEIDDQALKVLQERADAQVANAQANVYTANMVANNAKNKSNITNIERDNSFVDFDFGEAYLSALITGLTTIIAPEFTAAAAAVGAYVSTTEQLNDAEVETITNTINNFKDANEGISPSAEQLKTALIELGETGGVSSAILNNLDEIINTETINSFVTLADSMREVEEANRYYAEQILGIATEELYGDKIRQYAIDSEGNFDQGTYNLLLEAVKAQNNDEEILTSLENVTKNSYSRSEVAEQAGFTDFKFNDEQLAKTYAEKILGVSADSYNVGFGKGTIYYTKDGEQKQATFEDDKMIQELGIYFAKQAILDEYKKTKGNTQDDFVERILPNIQDKGKELGSKWGIDFSNGIITAIANKNGSAIDFSYLFKDISPEQFKDISNSLDDNTILNILGLNPEDNETFKSMGYDNATQFLEAFKEGLNNYSYDDYFNKINEANEKANSTIDTLLAGKKEVSPEDYNKLEESLKGITNQYAELVAIRDKGSKEYLDRLISIREELDKQTISNAKLNKEEAIKSSKELKPQETVYDNWDTNKEYGIKIGADTSEIMESLDEIMDADYQIEVAVHADIENDFDTVTSQMEEAYKLVQKIDENFIVSASDLRELNNQFPGILQGIQYLEDGTAKLNKDSVDLALRQAQLEKGAVVETMTAKIEAQNTELKAKSNQYRKLAEMAYAGAEDETKVASTVAEIQETLQNEEVKTQAAADETEIKNDIAVGDNAVDVAEGIARSFSQAYTDAGNAAQQFAEEAIKAQKAVWDAARGEDVDFVPTTVDYTVKNDYDRNKYLPKSEENTIEYESGLKVNWDELTDSEALKKFGDNATAIADYYDSIINDNIGMLAEATADLNKIDELKTKKSSSSKNKNKKDKYYEDEFDRYRELKIAIEDLTRSMSRLDKIQSKLHGPELQKSLELENKLLDKRIAKNKELMEEQKKEIGEINGRLANSGFTFDETGEITNYQAQTKKLYADYQALIDGYNAGTVTEKEYDKATQVYEKMKKDLQKHDERMKDFQDTYDKVSDDLSAQIDNNLKGWEEGIQLRLDTREAERDWRNFFDKVNDDFKSIYKNYGSSLQNKLFNSKSLGYTFNIDVEEIQKAQAEIDTMMAGGQGTIYHTVAEARDYLKQYSDQMREDAEKIFDLYQEGWEDFNGYIDDAIDKFDKLTDKFERINDDLDHQGKLIELLYGENDFNNLDNLYDAQKKNYLGEMASLRDQAAFFKQQYEELVKIYGEDNEAAEKFKESWLNAVDELHSKEEEYLDTLAKRYANSINKAFSDFEKKLTGGSNFDFVSEQWDLSKKAAEGVFDEQEKIYQLQTLGNKYQEAINKASSAKSQQKLADLMASQVDSLKDKTRLTQYDVELAEKRLAVAEAEAALEDARENKNALKVTRGDDGNWSYQYVADEGDVDDKEQALLDAQYDAYEFVKQNVSDTKEALMELAKDWEDHIRDLEEKMIAATEEEKAQYQEMIDWYNNYYGEQMSIKAGELKDHEVNLAQETNALLQTEYLVNEENYQLMTDNQKALIDGLREYSIQSATDIYNGINGSMDFIAEKGDEIMRETIEYFDTAASEITDRWANEPDSVAIVMQEAMDQCHEALDLYIESVHEGTIAAGEDFTNVGAAIDADKEKTNELKDATSELVEQADEDIHKYIGYLDELKSQWEAVIGWIDLNKIAIDEYLEKIGDIRPAMDDAINSIQAAIDKLDEFNNKAANGGPTPTPKAEQKVMRLQTDANGVAGLYGLMAEGSGTYSSEFGITNNRTELINKAYNEGYIVKDANGNIIPQINQSQQSIQNKPIPKSGKAVVVHGIRNKLTGEEIPFDSKLTATFEMDKNPLKYPKMQYEAFDTGGYTGAWNNDSGKFAMLHQKELVLNADDTDNMLKAVSAVRDLSSIQSNIQQAVADSIAKALINIAGLGNASSTYNSSTVDSFQNNVFNINADFPNANSVLEIQEAILGLPNAASQAIGRQSK